MRLSKTGDTSSPTVLTGITHGVGKELRKVQAQMKMDTQEAAVADEIDIDDIPEAVKQKIIDAD